MFVAYFRVHYNNTDDNDHNNNYNFTLPTNLTTILREGWAVKICLSAGGGILRQVCPEGG